MRLSTTGEDMKSEQLLYIANGCSEDTRVALDVSAMIVIGMLGYGQHEYIVLSLCRARGTGTLQRYYHARAGPRFLDPSSGRFEDLFV